MKIKKYFLNYGYAYFCYYLLGNFFIAFLPIIILATNSISSIKISKTYFALIIYMISISCLSAFNLESRVVSNLISSQKVYIFVISYILIYSVSNMVSTRDLFIFASRFMTFFFTDRHAAIFSNPKHSCLWAQRRCRNFVVLCSFLLCN